MSNGEARLEALPSKRYYTIGEVSRYCGVKDHVLRYWEKEIPELSPKRRRKRRYYEREHVDLIQRIQALVQEGYTLSGARRKLQGQAPAPEDTPQSRAIRQAVAELEAVVEMLRE